MPHKHKRRAEDDGDDVYNLPPTQHATPLPVGKARAPNPRPKKRKIVTEYGADDTPKAFQRLMAFKERGKGPNKGLDNGKQPKKSKPQNGGAKGGDNAKQQVGDNDAIDSEAQVPTMKIMPGEKLSDFAQRVNQALPLAGVQRNGKKIAGVADHRVTRHEKKLKKLQKGWREEEARIRDKELEAQELAEEEQDEIDAMWEDKTADLPDGTTTGPKKGKKKKGKGKRLLAGEVDLKEEDPWEALKKSREQRKGLHDVVQAPPTFTKIPREIFKVKDGARVNVGNVPVSAGSLAKREQLGEERQTIIDTYRKMMAANRKNE